MIRDSGVRITTLEETFPGKGPPWTEAEGLQQQEERQDRVAWYVSAGWFSGIIFVRVFGEILDSTRSVSGNSGSLGVEESLSNGDPQVASVWRY